MAEGNLLIVDDNPGALSALKLFLQHEFRVVMTLKKPDMIPEILETNPVDIILLDMNFSAGVNTGSEGLFWLKKIKELNADIEVVMFTAYGDVEIAVKALKMGAADFVLKPWENEKLLATLKSALRLRNSRIEINHLKQREQSFKDNFSADVPVIIGSSPAMLHVMEIVGKVAATDANILITGENGTGKEVIAKEIHRRSSRASELMVSVDMGTITESLFESELFGHVKGSFTDAKQDRIGKFQLADKSTLFLDEIGNLSLSLQSKLLTVLQSRTVIPVGSNKAIPIDIRLLSATNCPIEKMVSEKTFREDLMYRLNTIHINVPPLRERGDDIEWLAAHFLKQFEKKYRKKNMRLDSAAIRKLKRYPWPGNVRELQHTIEKAVILASKDILGPDDFEFKEDFSSLNEDMFTLEQMEQRLITAALSKHHDNLTLAAKQLGISRQTLYNKIKRDEH
jgi:DNA-binding NtrC family response regulator